MKWFVVCRWLNVVLVVAYVWVTFFFFLTCLILVGMRLSDAVRWMMLAGWMGMGVGGVAFVERLCPFLFSGCRLPIRAEEERLVAAMEEIKDRARSKMRVRFLIRNVAEKRDGSLGYRTILVSSGSLQWASDGELRGMLAHELGHLRDGDRALEAAGFAAGWPALLFRIGCRVVRRAFRTFVVVGVLVLLSLALPLLLLVPFFLLDGVFRVLRRALAYAIEYRQDAYAFGVGCGDGLRAWLEKSGVSAHVGRIRRLEKLAGLRA
jgi:heat shock protein HtpX